MRLVASYNELIKTESPYFNNEVSQAMSLMSEDIDEIMFIDFPFEDIKELLYLIQLRNKTGRITFETDGVLYKYSEENIHVLLS